MLGTINIVLVGMILLYAAAFRWLERKKHLFVILLAAFLFRVIVGYVTNYHLGFQRYMPDQVRYHCIAADMMNNLDMLSDLKFFYAAFHSLFYFMFDKQMMVAQVVNAFFGTLAAALAWKSVKTGVSRNSPMRPAALWVFAFLPSFVIWTSLHLREALVFYAVLLGVANAVPLFQRSIGRSGRVKNIILIFLSMTIVFFLRNQLIHIFGAGFLLYLFFIVMRHRRSVSVLIGAALLFLTVYAASNGRVVRPLLALRDKAVLTRFEYIIENRFRDPKLYIQETARYYNHFRYRKKNVYPPAGVMADVFSGTLRHLIRPSLFDFYNLPTFVSALENCFFTALLIYWLMRFFSLMSFIRRRPLMLLLFSLALAGAVSLGFIVTNFGTAFRFKMPFLFFWVALCFQFMSQRKPVKALP